MSNIKELIGKYLEKTRVMQLATSVDNQPWIFTVYYAFDNQWTFYWVSLPEARHSQEIAKNPIIAGAMAYDQQPPQRTVRGLQFQGTAKLLSGNEEEQASKIYTPQLNRETTLLDDIRSGKNPHKFYCVKPDLFVLYDRENFPDNPRQEWRLN